MSVHPEPAAGVRGLAKTQTRCANCPAQPRDLPTAGAGAVRGPALGTSRGRARLGKNTNPVRDLLGVAALKKAKEQSSAFQAFLCVGERVAPTIYIFMEVWRGLLPGRREQEVGFLPARENRSPVWARTRNQPRACEAGQKHKPGARLARRSRATCSPQARAFARPQGTGGGLSPCPGKQKPDVGHAPGTNRVRARRGEEKDTVRELPAAGARACETRGRKDTVRDLPGAAARLAHRRCRSRAWAHTRNQPRACETRGRKRHGARLARRSRATCSPQARAFARPQGTGGGLSPCPGKQKPDVGHAPGTNRVRARRGEEKDTVRELPAAGARACETRGRKDTVRVLPAAGARGRSRQGEPLCGQPSHKKLQRG